MDQPNKICINKCGSKNLNWFKRPTAQYRTGPERKGFQTISSKG